MAIKRGIPSATHIEDLKVRQILEALSKILQIGLGREGNFLDSFLTVQQLRDIGVIGVDANNVVYNPNLAAPVPFQDVLVEGDYLNVFDEDGNLVTDNDGNTVTIQP